MKLDRLVAMFIGTVVVTSQVAHHSQVAAGAVAALCALGMGYVIWRRP